MSHVRMRSALAGGLAMLAVLAGMVPAGATNGTIWTTLPSMSTARGALGAAAAPCPPGQTGTCFYAVGGGVSTSVSGTVESYNGLTGAWSTLPALPTARSSLAVVAAPCPAGQSGTCVYALGGLSGVGTVSAVVESYNPVTNAWSTVASMRTARSSAAAAAAPCPVGQTGTCVYAISGANGTGFLASVESYNPAANAWSAVAPVTVARSGPGAAPAECPPGQKGTCVYVVSGGGASGLTASVEAYNPATNAWSPMAPIPTPRTFAGVAATGCPPGQTGTCVYAVGGGTGTARLDRTESYSPATNAWTALPPQPTPRDYLGAAAMPCPPGMTGSCIYTAGGTVPGNVTAAFETLDPPPARKRA